jgi:hypothetical protein
MTTVVTGNPWLQIPLDDYESHMSLPAVGQAQMIADQLERAIARWAPASPARSSHSQLRLSYRDIHEEPVNGGPPRTRDTSGTRR